MGYVSARHKTHSNRRQNLSQFAELWVLVVESWVCLTLESELFNALTAGGGAHAEAANYPFCTISPNTGIVKVPDPRLKFILSTFLHKI